MQHHVKQFCRKASSQLWNTGRMRHLLNAKTAETLVHAYYHLAPGLRKRPAPQGSKGTIAAAPECAEPSGRIVTRAGKQAHSKDLLEQLHWLPVSSRVAFKILLLTFRALLGLVQVYLSQLLTVYRPTRTLRSRSELLLSQPKSRKDVWRPGFLSRCTTPLEFITHRSAAVNSLDDFKINLKTLPL